MQEGIQLEDFEHLDDSGRHRMQNQPSAVLLKPFMRAEQPTDPAGIDIGRLFHVHQGSPLVDRRTDDALQRIKVVLQRMLRNLALESESGHLIVMGYQLQLHKALPSIRSPMCESERQAMFPVTIVDTVFGIKPEL